jgi:DnaK suppressor protein
MARKDALLRLTSRLIARRDALRKALNGDLDSFRRFSELNAVGDNVDAAVDSAND